VLFGDSLAQHLLSQASLWSLGVRPSNEGDTFGLAAMVVRLYFGHFLIAILESMFLVIFGAWLLNSSELFWFYDFTTAAIVFWWATFTYTAIYQVRPELERLRALGDSTFNYLPTNALRRRARRNLSKVLTEARSHTLPAVMSFSGALLLMATLTMMNVLAAAKGEPSHPTSSLLEATRSHSADN
jgi:hypothetical protein